MLNVTVCQWYSDFRLIGVNSREMKRPIPYRSGKGRYQPSAVVSKTVLFVDELHVRWHSG